ncbi:MAG TPA: SDR family NAD(P)-dependent oxidoreductase [Ktedonobacterales bacterium]|nr:SDR family NAD(P)-dependent oxidoreductase [Ktedonobacterales bacterium]
MTDIRRHLPGILACLRDQLANASEDAPALRSLAQAALTELLPASYAIASGHLVNAQGERSGAIDVIIYDTTIPATEQRAQEDCYALRQALLAVMLAPTYDRAALEAALEAIASVKRLRPTAAGQAARPAEASPKIAKQLFPLGLVGCLALDTEGQAGQEAQCLALDAALKQQAERLRPEYVILQAPQLTYSSPLLDGSAFAATTINIACGPALAKAHQCYVCKQKYTSRHFFYAELCLRCGDLNYQKRRAAVDLAGRVALVTGARVKIGYATALRLLRAGAQVIASTRFPHDAARRYSQEPDFSDWRDRLQIYGLDLRHLPTLERFAAHLAADYPALDMLINNAAQTVKRPPTYYAHLLPGERAPLSELPQAHRLLLERGAAALPPALSSLPEPPTAALLPGTPATPALTEASAGEQDFFPAGVYDEHQQQIDLRPANSWSSRIDEIDPTEFLEVQLINVTAPYLLVSRLRPLLRRSPFPQRFVVNVSAAEGQFAQSKTGAHAHTNMAKAALNMLTHTAAADLADDGIFMNSVDPGWISQQTPFTDWQTWEGQQRLLPLDLIDAAARVCDPIFTAIQTGQAAAGMFFKDYQPAAW